MAAAVVSTRYLVDSELPGESSMNRPGFSGVSATRTSSPNRKLSLHLL